MFDSNFINTLEKLLENINKNSTGHKKIDDIFGDFFQKYEVPEVLNGWDFRLNEIKAAEADNRMYHADIDTPFIKCHHRCQYCFVGQGNLDPRYKNLKPLEIDEWENLINELSREGVTSVKIVGAGETLLDPRLFQLLDIINKANIIPVIFTSGDIIGDDDFSNRIHNMSGDELVDRILELGASLMVKFDSPINHIQDRIVNTKNFSEKRNNAIKRILCNSRIREKPEKSARLGLETNLGAHNLKDIFYMYALRKLMGVYVDVCLTMDCNSFKEKGSQLTGLTPKDIAQVYFGIYYLNKRLDIPYEGVSPYIGGIMCAQVTLSSIYVNYGGEIFFSCCGNDKRIGNFRETNISDIRKIGEQIRKEKYHYLELLHGCPFREEAGIIYQGLFQTVEQNLKFVYPN